MKNMLIEVVERGTGKKAQVAGLTIGGKTGTAHIAELGKYVQKYHSSFYGFAEDDKGHSYTIGILVIEAKAPKAYFASRSAVPVFKNIVEEMLEQKLLSLSEEKIDIQKMQKQQSLMHNTNQKLNIVNKKKEIASYRGMKTISPIKNATIDKAFGEYIDPVYKIKVFNESITLNAKKGFNKVLCVFDGKVVFAGKSNILDKVIVIAHKDNLHTVYAGLNAIASSIAVGKIVKKASVLGKVKDTLIFQVVQDTKYIDPLELIEL